MRPSHQDPSQRTVSPLNTPLFAPQSESAKQSKSAEKVEQSGQVRRSYDSEDLSSSGNFSKNTAHSSHQSQARSFSTSSPNSKKFEVRDENNFQEIHRKSQLFFAKQAHRLSKSLKDPLLVRPKIETIVFCGLFALLFLASSFVLWFVAVRTLEGQEFEDIVWNNASTMTSVVFNPIVRLLTNSWTVYIIAAIFGVISSVCVILRRRWELIGQLVGYCIASGVIGFLMKSYLPRPVYDIHIANPLNSSPSGHTLTAFTASVVLVLAAYGVWRWVAAIVGWMFSASVGIAVVVQGWHRPSDVIVAFLLSAGLACVALGLTRGSGMDQPGKRKVSRSLQIILTIMCALGLCGIVYAIYLVIQIVPGLNDEALWTIAPSLNASLFGIISTSGFCLSVIAALRQATASPLSLIGKVGAPPAPPQKVKVTEIKTKK